MTMTARERAEARLKRATERWREHDAAAERLKGLRDRAIRDALDEGSGTRELARMTGLDPATITRIGRIR